MYSFVVALVLPFVFANFNFLISFSIFLLLCRHLPHTHTHITCPLSVCIPPFSHLSFRSIYSWCWVSEARTELECTQKPNVYNVKVWWKGPRYASHSIQTTPGESGWDRHTINFMFCSYILLKWTKVCGCDTLRVWLSAWRLCVMLLLPLLPYVYSVWVVPITHFQLFSISMWSEFYPFRIFTFVGTMLVVADIDKGGAMVPVVEIVFIWAQLVGAPHFFFTSILVLSPSKRTCWCFCFHHSVDNQRTHTRREKVRERERENKNLWFCEQIHT